MKLEDVAADVGKGLFAGIVGTAAMTVSSKPEMKIRTAREAVPRRRPRARF